MPCERDGIGSGKQIRRGLAGTKKYLVLNAKKVEEEKMYLKIWLYETQ